MARRSSKRCTPENFGEMLSLLLREYEEEEALNMYWSAIKAGRVAEQTAKAESPHREGIYAAGWTTTLERIPNGVKAVVHNNGKRASLVHLLEKGHMDRGHGHWVGGKIHVATAFEKGSEELERSLLNG